MTGDVVAKGEVKAPDTGEDGKQPKRLFVITPIGENNSPERRHADWVLNAAIKPVFEPAGYTVYRSDIIDDPSMINDAIFNHIFEDDLCVADFTFLNPNVLYEVGVRHSQLKPVIHIAHVGTRLPFDTAQHRAIFFDLSDWHSVEALKGGLAKQLATVEGEGFEVSNPITHARGRIEVSRRGDDKDRLFLDLTGRIEALERAGREMHSDDGLFVPSYPHYGAVPPEKNFLRGISRTIAANSQRMRVLAERILKAYLELPADAKSSKVTLYGVLDVRAVFFEDLARLDPTGLYLLKIALIEMNAPRILVDTLFTGVDVGQNVLET